MCDPYGSAASAAQTAFSTAFTPAKQTDALKFGFKSIIAVSYTHCTFDVTCMCTRVFCLCVYITMYMSHIVSAPVCGGCDFEADTRHFQ